MIFSTWLLFYFFLLFFLWTSYWSFSSVIIYRLKNNTSWSLFWRSFCPHCKHKLTVRNLIPIFSYLFQKWTCEYCNKKISIRYLFLELGFWLVFVLFWLFVNVHFHFTTLVLFSLILLGILLLGVYDYLYKEVEDKIALPFVIFITSVLLYQDYSWQWLISLYVLEWIPFSIESSLISLLIIWLLYSTIFIKKYWIPLFFAIIIWSISIFSLFWFINFLLLTPSYLLFWSLAALIFFVFFFLQIYFTNWQWLWGGDLRFSIILWLLYWLYLIPWILSTYILAVLFAIILIIKNKKIRWVEIPFWPILFIAYFILLCFYR